MRYHVRSLVAVTRADRYPPGAEVTVVLERLVTIGVLVDDSPTQVTLLGGHGLLRTFEDASPGDLFEFSVEKVSG